MVDPFKKTSQLQRRMEYRNLLLGFFLCCTLVTASYSYMIFEEKQDTAVVNNNKLKLPDLPPISIVDLTKTSLKLSRKEAEKKKSMKKKAQQRKPSRPRPSPPPNCVATWASCKPPSQPCCDFCAFCHCRLFQTVCYCRMGNPNC
ncbi:agouti-signaling protein [Hemicordylus capensis]|uniref:agouti-signaling protein n=1 Tax=Hemicordylus capensis TaxID=884348 RepID=UPI002302EB63|nr:agouti-signaling protein [Hemicordylus capensis]